MTDENRSQASFSLPSAWYGAIWMLAVPAILAAILFPMMARARNDARKAHCLNNLKQCAQALKMYADDYNGAMPSSCLFRHSKTWSKRDSEYFCTGAGFTAGGQFGTWPMVLRAHRKSTAIVYCPSDDNIVDPGSTTPVSYWYKLANDKAWYGVGCEKPRRSMADYGYESDQIAFYERLGWHFGDETGLKNGIRINASFIDTHVETITIKNATIGNPENCAANSDGEPMYYNTSVDEKTGSATKQTGPATLTDPTCCYDDL